MISAILSVILVNLCYKIFMRIIGVNVMFFSVKNKIVWYIIVWFILIHIIGM